jgi:hypothetical protein
MHTGIRVFAVIAAHVTASMLSSRVFAEETLGVALLAVVFLFTLTQPAERTIAQETKSRAAIRGLELFMVRFLP